VGNEYPVPVVVTMGGNISVGGSLKFGPVEITGIHAALAFGTLENYISAGASAKVNGYSGSGGFFMGRSCTLGFLSWDPEVEAVLGTTVPFTGAYAYGEVWIPISEVLFGIPASCMFQVSGGVGLGAGFFLEGPTFVGKAMLGLDGDFLCVASLNCTLKMAGKANPDGLSMRGKASVEVEIGPCPLCAPISKEVTMTYSNGEWDADF
jgi:hypothetical protein